MLLNRTRSWLTAAAFLLLGTSAGLAQHDMQLTQLEDPYEYHNGQPFAMFDETGYGKGPKGPKPNEGFFGSIERMSWFVSKPDTSLIGSPLGTIDLTGGGLDFTDENLLTNGFLTGTPGWGNRYEFGMMVDDRGWLLSVFGTVRQSQRAVTGPATILFNDPELRLAGFTDANGDGIDDDLNGNSIFGRDGEDLGTDDGMGGFILPFDGIPDVAAPVDLGDLIYNIPSFSQVVIENHVEISGVEVMRSWRAEQFHNGAVLEYYAGARFLQIDDRFRIAASGGPLDRFDLDQKVDNHIVGPQVGARIQKQQGRFVYSAEGRFLAGVNFRSINQSGSIATNADPSLGTSPVNLEPNSFINSFHDEHFSPVGEFRVSASYFLTQAIAIKAGFTGIMADGIGRASNTIDYRLPAPEITDPGDGEDFFTTGFSLGIEVNR